MQGTPAQTVHAITLQGPVTAAFRREGKQWLCTVLEFDLLGMGHSRDAALEEMKDLVACYLEEVLRTPGKVRFFNPADEQDWNTDDKLSFDIVVEFTREVGYSPKATDLRGRLHDLAEYQDTISGVRLSPAAV